MQTSSNGARGKRKKLVLTTLNLLLSELLSENGIDQDGSQDVGAATTSAPPLDIEKHLLAIAQVTNHCVLNPQDSIQKQAPPPFPPLETITKPYLTTAELAYFTNMQSQSWRVKACYETFPEGLRPLRVCGKLAWPTAGAKLLLLGVK